MLSSNQTHLKDGEVPQILSRQLPYADNCGQTPPVLRTVRKDELTHPIYGAFVHFFNQGQSYVYLDSQIIIPPGGNYTEKNPCKDFSIQFIVNTNPPAVNKPLVYENNMLRIRILKVFDSESFLDSGSSEINASVVVNPVGSGLLNLNGDLTTNDFTIPANAVHIQIKNLSPFGNGAMVAADVGGIPLPPGVLMSPRKYVDEVNQIEKKLPGISVTTNGANIWYYYEI